MHAPSITPGIASVVPAPSTMYPPHHAALRNRVRPLHAIAAVLLVLALVAGTWNATGRPGLRGGGGNEPEQLQFGSYQDDGHEELFEIAPIPTAEECTVEPLSVDEVMDRVLNYHYPTGEPFAAANPSANDETSTPGGEGEQATASPEANAAGARMVTMASQDSIDAAAQSFRQWLACNLTGDMFRVWALETPQRMQDTILSWYGPVFSPAALRSDLETLQQEGRAGVAEPFEEDALFPMLVTSGWDSMQVCSSCSAQIRVPIYWRNQDGSIAGVPAYSFQEHYQDPAYSLFFSRQLPNQATFIYNADVDLWLLAGFASGGRG